MGKENSLQGRSKECLERKKFGGYAATQCVYIYIHRQQSASFYSTSQPIQLKGLNQLWISVNMEEGDVNVNARWIMPPKGMLKCTVRSFFSPEPSPNSNHSGIGVVFRNNMGIIMHMIAGSLGFDDQRDNQFNAFMKGMKEAFYEDYTNIILETDEVDPYWEWYKSSVAGGATLV